MGAHCAEFLKQNEQYYSRDGFLALLDYVVILMYGHPGMHLS